MVLLLKLLNCMISATVPPAWSPPAMVIWTFSCAFIMSDFYHLMISLKEWCNKESHMKIFQAEMMIFKIIVTFFLKGIKILCAPWTRWVPTETDKYFFFLSREIEGSSFQIFSLPGPSWFKCFTFRCALCTTKALLNSSLEVLPRGHHCPCLNFKGVIILL